jgi:hypothetical protein
MINIIEGWSKHILNEFGITEPPKFAIDRMEICKTCDEFEDNSKVCGNCGCYLEPKTLVKNEHCPLNKWQQ